MRRDLRAVPSARSADATEHDTRLRAAAKSAPGPSQPDQAFPVWFTR